MSDEKQTCQISAFGPGYRCGPHHRMFPPGESCPGPVIATEPETPVSEATEQMIPASLVAELLADAAQRYCPELERVEAEAYANSRWTHDARLRLLHAPAPSPEIRERAIELSRTLRLIKRLAIEHDTEIVLGHEYVDDLLLILDALKGEPK